MSGGDHAGPRVDTITVTCCLDSRAHEVPDAELAAAAARRNDGHYQALCGHRIAAAPMVEPDGRPCLLCAAIVERNAVPRRGARLQRILG